MASQFRIMGILGLDGKGFAGGLKQAEIAAARFGRSVSNALTSRLAAVFSVGAISIGINKVLEYADSVDEMAQRLGMATDKLQEFLFVAKQSGVSAEKFEGFAAALSNAAGKKSNAGAFAALGINPNSTPSDLIAQTSAWAQGKSGPEIRQGLSSILDARKIQPVIGMLQSDLAALGAEARKLGAVMDEATTKRLAKLKDQFSILGQILIGNFGPAILTAASAIVKLVMQITAVASYMENKTGMSKGKIALLAAMPGGIPALLGTLLARGVADTKEGRTTAEESLLKDLEAIDGMMKRLLEFTPTTEEAIKQTGEPGKGGKIQSDALLAAGNFFGQAQNATANFQRESLNYQRRTAVATEKAANKTASTDTLGIPDE